MLTSLPILAVSLFLAQDVDSGPAPGSKLPALKVQVLSGPLEKKEVDYVAERKDKTTIYVFVQQEKWSRPQHKFLFTLGEAIDKNFKDVQVVAVWLTEDKDKTREYLPKIAEYYKATALAYYPGDKTGPKGWDLNLDADVTVIVGHQQKVAARFGYQSINDTGVREITQALKKATQK